jgi:mRNA interferase MazF
MRPGEIYLAKFPFGDAPGMKIRPVLLLTDPVGAVPEILVAYISSVIPSRLLPSDLLLDPSLPEFRSTNLKISSALRLHKLATIHCSSLARYLGVIDDRTWSAVASKLKDFSDCKTISGGGYRGSRSPLL